MTTQDQKEEERHHLAKTMSLLGIHYNICGEHEPPDFVVEIGDSRVGIEITKLYRNLEGNGNSAKQEHLLSEVTEKAIRLFKEMGGPNLCFGIGYNGRKYIRNNQEFVKQLANFLLNYCHAEENQGKVLPHKLPLQFDDFSELAVIENIHVDVSLTNEPSGFSVSSFSSAVPESLEIDRLIERKSSIIERYQCCADLKWLIIILPAMNMAADLRLPESVFTCINHGFNKIYILDLYRNKIVEVNSINA